MQTSHDSAQSGFTLVELIGIMVLIGILAAVSAPRLIGGSTFKGRGFYDQSMSMLRYAQKLAIAQRTNVFVNVDAANSRICLTSAASPTCSGSFVRDPADNSDYSKTAPAGVSLSSTATSFSFSGLGQPSTAVDVVLTVTYDGAPHTVTVSKETGYVR